MLDQPLLLSTLSESQKDALIVELLSRIEQLEEQNRLLAARVSELEAQRKKDSRTSGKPPSSDGLGKKPRANGKSLRPKGDRKRGGQAGHKGHTLTQVETPDHVQEHYPGLCGCCGTDLSEVASSGYERRQVYDLPPMRLEVTEHRAHHKHCPSCASSHRGTFPPEVIAPVQYGAGVKAVAVYLKTYQLLPYERLREWFSDLFDHRLSVATLSRAEALCAQRIVPVTEAVHQALVEASVVHFDESGLRVEGRLHWLHTACTPTLTWYMIHPKRGLQALKDGAILAQFSGVAVHDHWASYFHYGCDHGLCNAHHLRELRLMEEHYQQPWAVAMAALLRDAHQAVEAHRRAGKTSLHQAVRQDIERGYDDILNIALATIPSLPDPPPGKRGRKKQHPAKNLYDRLYHYKAAVLRFVRDFRVPFDNNQAERDIRMIKAQQKISGTFRTRCGADIFAGIRGYISTAKKQGQCVLDVLRSAIDGQPWMPDLG